MNINKIRKVRLTLIKENLYEALNSMIDENQKTGSVSKIRKFPREIQSIFKKCEKVETIANDATIEGGEYVDPEEYYTPELLMIKKNLLSGCLRLRKTVVKKKYTVKEWKAINAVISEMKEQIIEFDKEAAKAIKNSYTTKKRRV